MEFDTSEWKIKMQQKPMYKEQINLKICVSHQAVFSWYPEVK